MLKVIFLTLAVASSLVLPSMALAAKGVVVREKFGCDYFIVETGHGYAVLQWYGGSLPTEGDMIVGDFESYGTKDIFNLTDDSELSVWVDDFWLSREDAIERYYENCD